MTWTQSYTPVFDSLLASALIAALPLVVLLGLLGWFQFKAHHAALLGLLTSLAVAIYIYQMPPVLGIVSAVYGAAYGLFPIGWIVLCAIFVYDITVATGTFEVVKESIAGLADDRRIQVLLVAFCFGAFIEGAAGFGTPVAMSAAMLIGLGFRPLQAAGLSLIGNTAPVAFGALGTPIIALAGVTGLPLLQLSGMVGRQLPLFSFIVPFWVVWAMVGLKATLEVWPACLVAGLSFACTQFLVSNYHGPWVVDIASSSVSMAALVLLLRFWHPRTVWRFDSDGSQTAQKHKHTRSELWNAWTPWILLSLLVFIWGLPEVKVFLDGIGSFTSLKVHVPALDKAVFRNVPIVPAPKAEDAVFVFNWLSATGTSLLVAGIVSGLFLRLSPLRLIQIFWKTMKRISISLLTIGAMLGLGFTIRYGGMDATLGLAFAATGSLFPFFSPLLGWLGVALTGSDTSSNVLFGNLQQITAQAVGISPILASAANSSGGVMGKMINAQSIVVAGAATDQQGSEGSILRYVFWHSLILACLVGVLVMVQAYILPMI
ncbi:MAG: L-lactate permease [Ignavibacteriales bacterium]|nr:L-lactate permease [Ignavibacteriales bacterium]